MARSRDEQSGEGQIPTSFAEVPPDRSQMLDHSFTLQAIMDLKAAVSALSTKVDRLIDDVGKHGEKIDTVRNQISFVRGAIWVLGGLIAFSITGAVIYSRFVH